MRNPCLQCDNRDGNKNCAACLNCERRVEYVYYLADPDNYVPGRAIAAGERSEMESKKNRREAATESHVDDAPERERPSQANITPASSYGVEGRVLYEGLKALGQNTLGLYDSEGNACGRFCSVCEKPLLFKDFYKSRHGTLGHQPHCKACDSKKTAEKHQADKRIADKNKRKKAGKKAAADRAAGSGSNGGTEKDGQKQGPVKSWPAPYGEVIYQPPGIGTRVDGAADKALTLDFSEYPELYDKLAAMAKDEFRSPSQQVMFLVSAFMTKYWRQPEDQA